MNEKFLADSYQELLSKIKSMGNCLEIALVFSNISKEELAHFLNIDKTTVSRMLNNSSVINSEHVLNICKYLGNHLLRDYLLFTLSKPDPS